MPGIELIEVSPRDGLQNERVAFPTETKLALIERLVAAGARRIEATSFVHPGRVPQMADAEAVMERVPRTDGVSYAGLALNTRGARRAVAARCDEINCVVVCSETFSRRNQGVGIAEGIETWKEVSAVAEAGGAFRSLTLAAAFGCPFEGEVTADRVREILVQSCAAARPDEIVFADTIGVGVPADVELLVDVGRAVAPDTPLRFHFHDTRNTGNANALAAVKAGVTRIDTSLGGIGGCPFAPAATGNLATEDLVYLLHRSGYETMLDLGGLVEASGWLGEQLGRPTPSLVTRAGPFPASA